MTYDATSPKAQVSPKLSPQQIKTNFQVFETAMNANHVAINMRGQGKHTNIIMKQQSADPAVTSTYGALYPKSIAQTSGAAINLFFRTAVFLPAKVSSNKPMQVTVKSIVYPGYTTGPISDVQYNNIQQSFQYGGFLIFFGNVSAGSAGLKTIDVAVTGSNILKPNKLIYANIQYGNNGDRKANFRVKLSASGSTFQTYLEIPGALYYYYAIGLV